jgi:hypothetical protein
MIVFIISWANALGEALTEANTLRSELLRKHRFLGE